jgi:hypothetical protein
MLKKTYLRSPNDDYAPDNNIQLGYVWRDPRDPGSFIGAPLPIPKDMTINHNYKGSWTIDLGRESHGKIGLWAKIAQLPVTTDARTHWDNAEDCAYSVPTMEYNKGAVLGEDMIPVGKSEGGEFELVIEDAEVGDDDVEVDGELYSFIPLTGGIHIFSLKGFPPTTSLLV